MALTREQVLVLAKEVLSGHARSYVSAAHAFAQYLVDGDVEQQRAVADATPTDKVDGG